MGDLLASTGIAVHELERAARAAEAHECERGRGREGAGDAGGGGGVGGGGVGGGGVGGGRGGAGSGGRAFPTISLPFSFDPFLAGARRARGSRGNGAAPTAAASLSNARSTSPGGSYPGCDTLSSSTTTRSTARGSGGRIGSSGSSSAPRLGGGSAASPTIESDRVKVEVLHRAGKTQYICMPSHSAPHSAHTVLTQCAAALPLPISYMLRHAHPLPFSGVRRISAALRVCYCVHISVLLRAHH